MLSKAKPVSFVATKDPARARAFYEGRLGLRVVEDTPYALVLDAGGTTLRVQKVKEVRAAEYTTLGWEVKDVPAMARALTEGGVKLTRYPGMDQDELGVWTSPSGARVAWFEDPDGNVLSVSSG